MIARADDLGAHAAQAEGGLGIGSLTQGDMALTVDRTAQAGVSDGFRISNRSSQALVVTVKARPWTQSASGAVSPNRRGTLSGVGSARATSRSSPARRRT